MGNVGVKWNSCDLQFGWNSYFYSNCKITIGPDGSVSMMGRRSLVSALEPLELFNGALFNVINWKKTEPNAVMATMVVTGTTVMNGLGVGRKVVPCP